MKKAPGKDVLGQAISDYSAGNRRRKLWVHMQTAPATATSYHAAPTSVAPRRARTFPREEMPIKTYFRTAEQMPELEWIALQHCRGRILDIGAGAGSHALALQQLGQDVTALEISPLSAAVIKTRGVHKVLCKDFFALAHTRRYDTLLLLMNGIGIAGNLIGLRAFLRQARALSRPGATLLFDSSDISYLYPKIPAPPP
jgi:SAM-dependent methyltransferase